MIKKFVCSLSLILVFAVTSALADVFWIDRYGNISWNEERARLDNFAFQILRDPDYIGYIYVNAGRKACTDEAQERAVRAEKYLVNVRGVPSERIMWKDLGYDDEAEVVFYIFLRSKPIPYNPEYSPAKEGQIIKDCNVKTRKRKKRGKNNAAPNKSLDVRAKQRLCLVSCPLNSSGLGGVSPHVNSAVRQLSVKSTVSNMGLNAANSFFGNIRRHSLKVSSYVFFLNGVAKKWNSKL